MSLFGDKEGTTSIDLSGRQPLIPNGTQLKCAVSGVTIEPATNFNNEHIKVALVVLEAGDYMGFSVNHKLQVNDSDISKKDKAITALLTYDSIAKGELKKADSEGANILFANTLARALNGTKVIATFRTWSMERDGETMEGNWVVAIQGSKDPAAVTEEPDSDASIPGF